MFRFRQIAENTVNSGLDEYVAELGIERDDLDDLSYNAKKLSKKLESRFERVAFDDWRMTPFQVFHNELNDFLNEIAPKNDKLKEKFKSAFTDSLENALIDKSLKNQRVKKIDKLLDKEKQERKIKADIIADRASRANNNQYEAKAISQVPSFANTNAGNGRGSFAVLHNLHEQKHEEKKREEAERLARAAEERKRQMQAALFKLEEDDRIRRETEARLEWEAAERKRIAEEEQARRETEARLKLEEEERQRSAIALANRYLVDPSKSTSSASPNESKLFILSSSVLTTELSPPTSPDSYPPRSVSPSASNRTISDDKSSSAGSTSPTQTTVVQESLFKKRTGTPAPKMRNNKWCVCQ